MSIPRQSPAPFYDQIVERVGRSEHREALVFIHGYNVGFDDAIYRTAQIAYDLGFEGAPILYSWPSNGRTLQYAADVNNSEWSIEHLKTFLGELARRSHADRIHVIGHSMGATRCSPGGLERLANDPAFGPLPRFSHVVLTAPDIDAGVFMQLAADLRKTASRVTLYASSSDKALQVSKRINGYPRAGDAGSRILVIAGIDTIDVSAADTDLLVHSYYGDNRSVLSDMFNLLRGQPPPRFGLREVVRGALKYWRFAP